MNSRVSEGFLPTLLEYIAHATAKLFESSLELFKGPHLIYAIAVE